MVAELEFRRGDEDLLRFRLERAEVCIGSHPTCDVVVPGDGIPEVAAVLLDRGAGRFRLRDLGGGALSVRGREPVGEELDLADGDVLSLGPYTLELRLRAGERVAASAGHTAHLDREQRARARAFVVHEGVRHPLPQGRPFNVGCADDNDLVLDDPYVSTYHARLYEQDGRWFLVDLESTNGTDVNGLRVREAELPVPATLTLGRAKLAFGVEATPAAGSPAPDRFHGMIASSAPMREVFRVIGRLAPAAEPVLIVGESGCGKELVARALHDASPRAAGPFLALNCGALSASLIEGELFGHTRGAFTGASADRAGAFEATDGGTLFLDEIGELPLDLQPKLLRVLEAQAVRRVGGTREVPVRTRVVAATHRNLEELVREGRFREDLFHRLFVLSVRIPPLRERPEDVLALARHFLSTQSPRPMTLTAEAAARLRAHPWPGNARELRNVLVRAVLLGEGTVIDAGDLAFAHGVFGQPALDARRALRRHDEEERQRLVAVLEQANGNRAEAARLAGVSKSTFHDRLKRHGIPLKHRERG
jgi:DNA-binding NtrC family response regulator